MALSINFEKHVSQLPGLSKASSGRGVDGLAVIWLAVNQSTEQHLQSTTVCKGIAQNPCTEQVFQKHLVCVGHYAKSGDTPMDRGNRDPTLLSGMRG
jgi:hypothetical protein